MSRAKSTAVEGLSAAATWLTPKAHIATPETSQPQPCRLGENRRSTNRPAAGGGNEARARVIGSIVQKPIAPGGPDQLRVKLRVWLSIISRFQWRLQSHSGGG